jgi:uncharacterized protein YukE
MDATTVQDQTTPDGSTVTDPTAETTTTPVTRTDFSAVDDATILAYIHAGMPELLDQVAEAWSTLGTTLAERGADLELEFGRLEPTWTGDSAESYAESVRSLIEATKVVGTMAGDLGEVVYSSASALAQVCAMYPPSSVEPDASGTDGGVG